MRLRRPVGQTLGLALVFLVLLVVLGELVARTQAIRSHLANPSWGGQHRHLDIQMGRLEYLTTTEGSIDCLFLGSSMVWRGFDPLAFSDAYKEQAGQDIRCFNFGINGLSAASANALAHILVQEYQPRLLIYGIDARDLTIPREAKEAAVLLDMPWIRFRLGDFSVAGWLIESSHLLRYRSSLFALLRFNHDQALWRSAEPFEKYGFDPDSNTTEDVSIPPDRQSGSGRVQYAFELLYDFKMLPENLAGLEGIASLDNQTTEVVVVTMPLPKTYLHFFRNGENDYQRFQSQVSETVDLYGASILPVPTMSLLPDDSWVDYGHVNANGAHRFSNWLGRQLGKEVEKEEIINFAPQR
ncbi:MAG: hypothetical protein JSW55_01565 [Chloroflexota bacterium]|nr:MAG: hypothetical protein JSW55_01565 [Chloroflexota bacterium]